MEPMKSRIMRTLLILFAVPLAFPTLAAGQSASLQTLGSSVGSSPAGVTSMQRTVTLSEADRTLGEALAEIAAQADLRLVYGSDLVPVDRRVTVGFEAMAVTE